MHLIRRHDFGLEPLGPLQEQTVDRHSPQRFDGQLFLRGDTMRLFLAALAALFLTPLYSQAQHTESVVLEDVTLRYEIAGEGPAVVLLHGWAHSLETWDFLFPELANEYRVVRYDRRGFSGSSGNPDTSLDPLDLLGLLDSLGIERVVVLGHSQGGNPALRFALEYPERLSGLVLYGSAPPSGFGLRWTGPDRLPPGYGRVAREQGIPAMLEMFEDHALNDGFVDGTEGAELARRIVGAYDGRDLLNPTPSAQATPAPDIGRLPEIGVPTLVITGELEMPYLQVIADAMAYAIPGASRIVVPGGGHSVHLQQPERFNGEVRRFLKAVHR